MQMSCYYSDGKGNESERLWWCDYSNHALIFFVLMSQATVVFLSSADIRSPSSPGNRSCFPFFSSVFCWKCQTLLAHVSPFYWTCEVPQEFCQYRSKDLFLTLLYFLKSDFTAAMSACSCGQASKKQLGVTWWRVSKS